MHDTCLINHVHTTAHACVNTSIHPHIHLSINPFKGKCIMSPVQTCVCTYVVRIADTAMTYTVDCAVFLLHVQAAISYNETRRLLTPDSGRALRGARQTCSEPADHTGLEASEPKPLPVGEWVARLRM